MANGFYQYMRTKGNSTIRNNPINEEWEHLMSKMSENQDKLLNLLLYHKEQRVCSDESIANFEYLIVGDVCEFRLYRVFFYLCAKIPKALLSNGIIGMNSHNLFTFRYLKDVFDHSDKTVEDAYMISAQSSMINLDLLIATFQSLGYIYLQSNVRICTEESLTVIEENLKMIMTIYITVMVVTVPILLTYLLRKLEKERVGWRKMLRKIPLELIVTNKVLKFFISKESDFALQV